ncbi:hypothetical protein HAX54_033148 [Datura stramonium]|uniref:Uncharacterized protein n=1 Tax=Datura stramonium TaxID=4076 RepID=A0ABS8VBZ9_DATST|nr:hypothetical protein [Datura stramonium]
MMIGVVCVVMTDVMLAVGSGGCDMSYSGGRGGGDNSGGSGSDCSAYNYFNDGSGVEISSLLSIGKSTNGRSLVARHPIKPGDCLLKVPYNVQLAPDNLPRGINALLGDNVGNVAKVALLILYEQKLGKKSEWEPYISRLPRPEDMHSTIFWDDNELQMIRRSSLHQKTIMHKLFVEQEFLSIKEYQHPISPLLNLSSVILI